MLTALGKKVETLCAPSPWSNVYGVARTLVALGTLVTLLATPTHVLFQPTSDVARVPICTGVRSLSAFCIAPDSSLETVRWLSAALLLVVATGWRPRWTGIVHWFLAFSLQASSTVVDGGDHVATVLAFLFVPLTLLDGRQWHWTADEPRPVGPARIFSHITLFVCRLQVAGIYLHAAAGKFMHEEWANGTAVYYWFTHPSIGAHGWVLALLRPVVSSEAVVIITWGTIVLEFCFVAAIFASRGSRRLLFWLGVVFHLAILLIHGLVSFVIIMFGALVLLMRKPDEVFCLPRLVTYAGRFRTFLTLRAVENRAWSPSRSKT